MRTLARLFGAIVPVVAALGAVACGSSGGAEQSGVGDAGNGGSFDATSSDARSDASSDAASRANDGAPNDAANASDSGQIHALVLIFGGDVLPAVETRITALLTASSPLANVITGDANTLPTNLASDSIVLSFGDTAATRSLVPSSDLAALTTEGIIVRSGTISGASAIVAVGNTGEAANTLHGNRGTAYAAYALLEELGFAFLHPLAPTIPVKFTMPTSAVAIAESPAWRVRGIHVHTEHPTELEEMLEGFVDAPDANAGTDEAGWEARLPEWDSFLEWMLANRQNRVEWVLLDAAEWSTFAMSPARQTRFTTLVNHAHAFGVAAGADAALALTQQHDFRLVQNQTGVVADETAQIDTNLDWIFAAGFDYLSTESGTTEFTSSSTDETLAWMNEAAIHTQTTYNAPAYIKAHCSTGQVATGYTDPYTNAPLNFNFLPMFADARVGVMPHTVEIYGLDDPAPTYGNTDFGYMRDFLQEEVGTREVVWHPETAYWVTYDIDVPLFLPIYAERRVADLRTLAGDETAGRMGRGAHAGGRMDGQVFFSSGWEWGYWLNDVVAARASWNPHTEAATSHDALVTILKPLARVLGANGDATVGWIADVADSERAMLIDGTVNGVTPADVTMVNGIAYLEGYDATDDLGVAASQDGIAAAPVIQPEKLGLVDLRNPFHSGPDYTTQVAPLLAEMETNFGAFATTANTLAAAAPAASVNNAASLIADLDDAARVTALRATQVHGLYDYVNLILDPTDGLPRLQTARSALDTAATIVAAREPQYRVPADRIGAWRSNPTAYGFTYLWFVRSLYFWWRDEGKAVDAPLSPCYLNVMNPVEVGLGESSTTDVITEVSDVVGSQYLSQCLNAPTTEPTFPQDNLRSRP